MTEDQQEQHQTDTKQYEKLHRLIESAQAALVTLQQELNQLSGDAPPRTVPTVADTEASLPDTPADGEKIIEGMFDGQHMVGPDGKQYSVPANYASKSKLVDGDRLKLTIAPDGSFIYKQIGPVDRDRMVGKLTKDEVSGEYRVLVDDHTYRVLLASITYFKGDAGDEVVILVPKGQESEWAAVENIIKQT